MKLMAVIQPNNKSLFAKNIKGNSLLVSFATFILRVNDPQPTKDSYRFKYKADTGKVELSTDNGQSYSGDFSVTSDGSTFNNNVGSSGLDFILQSNPSAGNEFEVVVKAGNDGEDTYIRQKVLHENYGSAENLFFGTTGAFDQFDFQILIRFNIKSYFSELLGTESQWRFVKTTSSFIRVRQILSSTSVTVKFYGIADSDSDWIPGTENNAIQDGSPDWEHKFHDTTSWSGGSGNPALDGSEITEEITVSSAIFYTFNGVGGRLNSLVDRWLKNSVNNGIRTVHAVTSNQAVFRGSDTSQITLKPYLVFIYETVDGENHGGSGAGFIGGDRIFPDLATSMGSEDTFGGA